MSSRAFGQVVRIAGVEGLLPPTDWEGDAGGGGDDGPLYRARALFNGSVVVVRAVARACRAHNRRSSSIVLVLTLSWVARGQP